MACDTEDASRIWDPLKAIGSICILAAIIACGYLEVRLVWWAIDAVAGLFSVIEVAS